MRVTDAKLALPSLVFGIFLAAVLSPGLWTIILILMLVFWTRYARVIRGEVLSLRERDFVKLAEVTGASKIRVMLRHILPNIMNTAMVLFSLTVGVAIILEASLSFLGVGVPPPTPTWGKYAGRSTPDPHFRALDAHGSSWSLHHAVGAGGQPAGRLDAGVS